MLPNSIATAPFLKEEERVFAVTRLHLDTPSRLALDGRCVILSTFKCSQLIFQVSTTMKLSDGLKLGEVSSVFPPG